MYEIAKTASFPHGRNEVESWEDAQTFAAELTEQTGRVHIATDTPRRYPQFDAVRAPRVGDPVSKGFNGDYYPDGVIVKVSESLRRVETSTGSVYWRRRRSGTWVSEQTWSMVSGHVSRRNPHL